MVNEEVKGWNWEEMFLHFKEDSYMDAKEITTNKTIWVGNPTIKLYQVNSNSWMYPWQSSVDVLSFSNSGGGLIIGAPEPFAELEIESLIKKAIPTQDSQIIIEYPRDRKLDKGIANWGRVSVVLDTTQKFSEPGVIKWLPPDDWKWVILNNSSYAYKGRLFIIRLRVVNFLQNPQMESFSLRKIIYLL